MRVDAVLEYYKHSRNTTDNSTVLAYSLAAPNLISSSKETGNSPKMPTNRVFLPSTPQPRCCTGQVLVAAYGSLICPPYTVLAFCSIWGWFWCCFVAGSRGSKWHVTPTYGGIVVTLQQFGGKKRPSILQ